MGFDKVKIRQICWIIFYVAVLVFFLLYMGIVLAGLKLVLGIFLPFLIGAAIAFILNIPMNGIEKKILGKWHGKAADKLKRPISIVGSLLFVVAILMLVVVAVVPQLETTITTLGAKIPPFIDDTIDWLQKMAKNYPELAEQVSQLDKIQFNWESILSSVGGFLKTGVGNVLGSTISVASSIFSGVVNTFISFVFALYILSQKEALHNQFFRIVDAYAPVKINRNIREVCRRLYGNFTNFICGQCVEAVILGCLFVIFMTIFKMPYAIMVGTLIAFTALIPVVGAFIGCGVGAFMIFIDNPVQALWFVVMFLVIQQLEGNLIYPRVVGNSVGLPSIWVLMSVTVGGSLFGVVGMLVFIPLVSTFYSLLRDDVNRRNAGKFVQVHPKQHKRERQNHKKQNPLEKNQKAETVKVQEKTETVKGQEKTEQSQKSKKVVENKKSVESKKAEPFKATAEEMTPEEFVAKLVAEREAVVQSEFAQEEAALGEAKKEVSQQNRPKKPYYKKRRKPNKPQGQNGQ